MSLTEESIPIQRAADFIREFLKWSRYSSTQKLMTVVVVGAVAAVLLGQCCLFALLIVSMVTAVIATGWMLSTELSHSDTDPLAQQVERLFQFIEALKAAKSRVLDTESHAPRTELRARSESIACPPIPDLDVDGDSGLSGVFSKAIRLELNSIVLLIIRDFVHIWYHKFSYNPQFPKDSRAFIFKAVHNVVERISRLSAHQNASELVQSYNQHLASFQEAKLCMQQIQAAKSSSQLETDVVQKVFQETFQLHYALENDKTEHQYLRAITKVILLATCTPDVMSTRSTMIFLTEVLSMNVVLPVVQMLSTPDWIYELLITLAYSSENNAIVSGDILRQLIDSEVQHIRSQLHSSSFQKDSEKSHNECLGIISDHRKFESEKCVEDILQDPEPTQESLEQYRSLQETSKKNTSEQKSAEAVVRKSKTYKGGESRSMPDGKENTRGLQEDETMKGSHGLPATDSALGMVDRLPCGKHLAATLATVTPPVASSGSDTDTSKVQAGNISSGPGKSVQKVTEPSKSEKNEEEAVSSESAVSSSDCSEQKQNIYGEIVTTVPTIGPKFRAFKDLFRTKKSKQQHIEKVEVATEVKMEQEGQDEVSKISSESLSSVQRLKSLRLSPLLSRSNKFLDFGSRQDKSLQQDFGSQVAVDKTDNRDPASDSLALETDREQGKHSPVPLTTPSPTQLIKFLQRIRKPPVEAKKSPDVKRLESPPAEQESDAFTFTSVNDASSCKSPADLAGPGLVVPSVQVTDESDRHNGDSTSRSHLDLQLPYSIISVSSYDVTSTAGSNKEDKRGRSVVSHQEGEGEEGRMGSEGDVVQPLDSSFIFQDIAVPVTMTCQEFRSNAQFTLYQIEYEALHFSDTGVPVLRTGSVKRRYREFVNLMSCLEDNSAYKKLLKDVKGPKWWQSLPFKNMDKENISSRQKALEHFLKALIQVEAVCNGPELREFLAYEGDSHIAFVRRATEINVPRIDKMLVKTMSGVFDKLKSLPNLPQEVISGIRGRDSTADRKDDLHVLRDADSIMVATEFSQQMPPTNLVKDFCKKFIRDVQTEGLFPRSPASPLTLLLQDESLNLSEHMLARVPRLEGDGAESPDQLTSARERPFNGDKLQERLLMYDAVISLVVQLLPAQHWLCHERVLRVARNLFGRKMDRWLLDFVSSLTTEERCLYYIRLLRENVWPGGTFKSRERREKSAEEKLATKAVAKQLVLEIFPGFVHHVLGKENMDGAVDEFLESFQHSTLNKHFLYSSFDHVLEKVFPEMLDTNFQNRVLI